MNTRRFKARFNSEKSGDYIATTPVGTLSLSPSYNFETYASRQGCIACNMTLIDKIQVDGKQYKDSVDQSDSFEITIEPTTGFMIKQRKDLSVFLPIPESGFLPFPSLDNMKQTLVPLYDVKETLAIDTEKFDVDFGFV